VIQESKVSCFALPRHLSNTSHPLIDVSSLDQLVALIQRVDPSSHMPDRVRNLRGAPVLRDGEAVTDFDLWLIRDDLNATDHLLGEYCARRATPVPLSTL